MQMSTYAMPQLFEQLGLKSSNLAIMPQLFEQLGLKSSNLAIARFIKHHHLPEDVALQSATFWNPAQRQFIKDSLRQDSDWTEVVDQLSVMLHH